MQKNSIIIQKFLYADQIKTSFLNKKTFIVGKKESGKTTIARYIINILLTDIHKIYELYEEHADINDYTKSINADDHHPTNIIDTILDVCNKNRNKNILVLLNFSSCIQYRSHNNFSKLFDQQNLTLIGYSNYPERFDNGRRSLYNVILMKDYTIATANSITNYYLVNNFNPNTIIQGLVSLRNFEFIIIDRYNKQIYHILDTPDDEDIYDVENHPEIKNTVYYDIPGLDINEYLIPEIKDEVNHL